MKANGWMSAPAGFILTFILITTMPGRVIMNLEFTLTPVIAMNFYPALLSQYPELLRITLTTTPRLPRAGNMEKGAIIGI